MDSVRTPDERSPTCPTTRSSRTTRDVPADRTTGAQLRVHYLDEGPVERGAGAADARRAVVELPVPAHDPAARRGRPPGRGAGPRRLRSQRQADRARRLHATPATSRGCRRSCSTISTCTTSRSSGRTGAASSVCASSPREPDRYARVVIGNTGLPTGDGPPSEAFLAWQKYSQEAPVFPIGNIVNGGSATDLSPEIIAAYDAPFPDDSYKAGARIFPTLVPTRSEDPGRAPNKDAWDVLSRVREAVPARASATATRSRRAATRRSSAKVPGAQGQPHTTIEGAGHFLQEDKGPELAAIIIDFIAASVVDHRRRYFRARSARSAACHPHMPCTPAPGGVDAEQRNSAGFGVTYGRGRDGRSEDQLQTAVRAAGDVASDVVRVVHLELRRRRDVSGEHRGCEAGREPFDLPFDRVRRVAGCSRGARAHTPRGCACPPGAREGSKIDGWTARMNGRSGIRPAATSASAATSSCEVADHVHRAGTPARGVRPRHGRVEGVVDLESTGAMTKSS